MSDYNKIELEYASKMMTEEEFARYDWGDILLGNFEGDDYAITAEYNIDQMEQAEHDLNEKRCSFVWRSNGKYFVREYALFTYREENGDYLYGGGFKLAPTTREKPKMNVTTVTIRSAINPELAFTIPFSTWNKATDFMAQFHMLTPPDYDQEWVICDADMNEVDYTDTVMDYLKAYYALSPEQRREKVMPEG